MNDTFAGDFNGTQTAVGNVESGQKPEGIAAVLIKQLHESSGEGGFQMWGMSFGMVYVCAIVRAVEPSSTKITYQLEDHTGRIEAHYWLDETSGKQKIAEVMIDHYVQVFGSVRSHGGGQKTLMVFKLRTITDPNEVCTHVLEALNTRFKSEEYAVKSEFDYGGGSASKSGGYDAGQNLGILSSGNDQNFGLEGKQLAVFQAIKNYVSDDGISRFQLRDKFAHINKEEMENILSFLVSEGHTYSSIDSDHFMSAQ